MKSVRFMRFSARVKRTRPMADDTAESLDRQEMTG
jgi:hypothetical protein